jgi:hypothetical protein
MWLLDFCLIIFIYFFIGFSGFYYWWTKEFKFTKKEIFLAVEATLFYGIFTWYVGKQIHSKK